MHPPRAEGRLRTARGAGCWQWGRMAVCFSGEIRTNLLSNLPPFLVPPLPSLPPVPRHPSPARAARKSFAKARNARALVVAPPRPPTADSLQGGCPVQRRPLVAAARAVSFAPLVRSAPPPVPPQPLPQRLAKYYCVSCPWRKLIATMIFAAEGTYRIPLVVMEILRH